MIFNERNFNTNTVPANITVDFLVRYDEGNVTIVRGFKDSTGYYHLKDGKLGLVDAVTAQYMILGWTRAV